MSAEPASLDGRKPSTLRTADRALRVLQEVGAADRALTVGRVADRLGVHRSTVSRLVGTLESRGFLERSGELLRLGPEMARLGRVAQAGRELASLARSLMDQLADETGETVTLAVPAGGAVLSVAQSDGRHFVTSGRWVGVRTAAHCCSDGKVLLAFGALGLPPGRLRRYAPNTIVGRRALAGELERVRARGFAVCVSELEDGLAGLAVPVRDGGACIAALCISGPAYRLDRDAIATFAPACLMCAGELEQQLGADRGEERAC
jgi:IclR family transcriptional regulator, acetate operon repressor